MTCGLANSERPLLLALETLQATNSNCTLVTLTPWESSLSTGDWLIGSRTFRRLGGGTHAEALLFLSI